MKILVDSMIRFNAYDIPQVVLDKIKADLTVPNLDKIKAEKVGRWVGDIPDSFRLYEITGGTIIIPRGYGNRLAGILKQHRVNYTIDDKRLILPQVSFGSKISLYNYQVPAVERLVKYRTGGVSAPCGSGKTMIGLDAIARVGQPALWITHTKELLEQAIERAGQVLDIEQGKIGVIGSGKFTLGDKLTVALVQTLAKRDLSEVVNRFGTVFIDEAHHLAANQFYRVVNQFPALYRMWASATPNRDDGKTLFIEAAGGPILYSIQRGETSTLCPRVVWVPTSFSGTYDSDDYQNLLDDIVNNQERNNLIVDTINALTQEVGRVLRPAPGKNDAIVFDFMDTNIGILKAQKYKRHQVYRKIGAAC